jgi:hypothetical protein
MFGGSFAYIGGEGGGEGWSLFQREQKNVRFFYFYDGPLAICSVAPAMALILDLYSRALWPFSTQNLCILKGTVQRDGSGRN